MEKHLTLFANRGRFNTDEGYVKVDNDDLIIHIDTEFGSNTELYAVVGSDYRSKIKDNKFVIPNEIIKIGELQIKIIAKVGSETIAEFTCTPIIVEDLDGEIAVIDEIAKFELELKNSQEQLNAMNEKLDKIMSLVKTMILVE